MSIIEAKTAESPVEINCILAASASFAGEYDSLLPNDYKISRILFRMIQPAKGI